MRLAHTVICTTVSRNPTHAGVPSGYKSDPRNSDTKPSDKFLIGIDLPPRVTHALARAYGQGIIIGSTKNPLEIFIINGDNATAATVSQTIITNGYI